MNRSKLGHRRAAAALALVALAVLSTSWAAPLAAQVALPPEPVVVLADRLFDGESMRSSEEGERIGVLIREGEIAAVGTPGALRSAAGASVPTVELPPDATLLPGLIDTHTHISWSFGLDGRTMTSESPETPEQRILLAAENAVRTLRGGVTTVQSLGREDDLVLRDLIARGTLPGPRILTSAGAITNAGLNPQQLRLAVRGFQQRGADVIKVFASASIRVGGTPTLSQEQLDAICGEAQAAGLRAVVHAHSSESAKRAALAGCTTIEHGALLDRETLELLAERGVFYDPNIDLVLRNYFENEERFSGVGNYTPEGFAQMRSAVPKALETFRTALDVPELRIVFGTDALAGAHGRNVQELIYRIRRGGQSVLDALRSATAVAAQSLDMADRIGRLEPGFEADVIAVTGDPLAEPERLEDVHWVMRAGRIHFGQLPTAD